MNLPVVVPNPTYDQIADYLLRTGWKCDTPSTFLHQFTSKGEDTVLVRTDGANAEQLIPRIAELNGRLPQEVYESIMYIYIKLEDALAL